MTRSAADRLFTAFLLVLAVWAVWMSLEWRFKTYLFPRMIGIALIALIVIQLAVTFLRPEAPAPDEDTEGERAAEQRRFWIFLLWLCVYVGAVLLLGFRVGGPLAALIHLRCSAGENWTSAIVVSLVLALFFYVSGHPMLIGVPYPEGWIISWISGLGVF